MDGLVLLFTFLAWVHGWWWRYQSNGAGELESDEWVHIMHTNLYRVFYRDRRLAVLYPSLLRVVELLVFSQCWVFSFCRLFLLFLVFGFFHPQLELFVKCGRIFWVHLGCIKRKKWNFTVHNRCILAIRTALLIDISPVVCYLSVNMSNLAPSKVKLVLLGDTAVGKTCIVQRYVNDDFTDDLNSTIGGV